MKNKLNNTNKQPKYSMRKLSVGLVSCVIGYGVFGIPVFAEKIDNLPEGHAIINTEKNIVTHNSSNNDGELELSISDIGNNMLLTSSYTDKKEVIVTDETKTPYNKEGVGDIDNTVLDSEGNFIGKEDGSVSISGNKEIANKKDLDKSTTVDEFNENSKKAKAKELSVKIDNTKNKIEENQKEANKYVENRSNTIVEKFKKEFSKDLEELSKYEGWLFRLSNIDEHTNEDNKNVYFEQSNNFNIDEYDKRSKYMKFDNTINSSYLDYKFDSRENYEGINKELLPGFNDGESSVSYTVTGDKAHKGVVFKTDGIYFDFTYKDSDVSDDFKNYLSKSNLLERMNNMLSSAYDDNYAVDKKHLEDKKDSFAKLRKNYLALDDELYKVSHKYYAYAKIKKDGLRSNKVEIIEDPTIWEGNFTWERYSKDGYIKTLYQNGEEIAKRVKHPLVAIKRIGTKTEETIEKREVESSTYDVVERPTDNKEENGKVVQEGSDGLVEKVYDTTYDKYSNIIKEELKETIVKKEQKDRVILRYGIKEETKTPATIYDGIKNYNADEKKIKNFSEDNRYRNTQLPTGDGVSMDFTGGDKINEFVDGFRYSISEPSVTSEDKTKWGIELEFDKEKSQRTYTNFYFTNTGNLARYLETGIIPSKDVEDSLGIEHGFKNVNYKAQAEIEITASGPQRNVLLYSNEEDLKHINNKDNNNTVMAWQGNYLKDNYKGPLWAVQGQNVDSGFAVNPWPNENDKLAPLKLTGTYDKKEYVKGQEIKTDIRIENLDKNAKERLVGQIYHPATGEVVKEADAYLGDDGYVYIKMPDGVINEDGTTNKDSIFNTPEYKALQNLDVKFFARPRTKDEFKKIAETPDEFGETGIYTETGAGSKFINHKGKEVEIDLQGIDRYDHYNLIGSFKLQLDDTRYYDQNFIGSDKKDTTKHTSIPILPGQDFTAKVYLPEDKKNNPYQKSDLDIKDDASKAHLMGKLDKKYLENYNKGKKEVDKWVIKNDDITKFTIIAPKTAKSGDFMAVPIEYTYTNGSKDTHWFHFVVQGSENNVPSYQTKVGYQGDALVSDVTLSQAEEDLKKNQPLSYELADDEYIDSEGNRWTNVTIDPKTGQVTAIVPKDVKIDGGEILTVNVKANYKDEFGIEKQEIVKAEFVARPKYDGKFEYTEYDTLPYGTEIKFDKTLKAGETKVVQEGEEGNRKRTITQEYQNEKLSDQVIGDWETTKEPKNRIIAVGSTTEGMHEYKEEIPFKYTVKEDPNLKSGEWKEEVKGQAGEKTTKWNIINSEIVGDPVTNITKAPVDAVIKVGKGDLNGTKTIEDFDTVEYETEIQFDNNLKVGEEKVTQEGKLGKKKRNITLTVVNGEVTNTEFSNYEITENPVNKIVKVGTMTEGSHSHTEDIPFKTNVEINPDLKKGEWRYKKINEIEQKGSVGKKTTTWTIKNSEIVNTEEKIVEKVDAIIEVGSGDFTGTISHQVTEEKVFDVEIVENPNMTAGTSNIKQKGVKGEVVTEYSQKIKNGEADGEMTSKEISNKPAVKQIIEVGTKPAKNNKDIDNNTDVKIEYVYDNTLDKGIVKTGELVKGNVKTEIVNKYNPKTGEIETVEKTVVTDAVQKIIVGSKEFTGEFTHKEKSVVPFKTIIQEDNTLKAGETKLITKGELGEKEHDIKQSFVDGKLGEKTIGEFKETKKPIDEVIAVGSLTEGSHSHTEDIPFSYEVIEDDKIEKGTYVIEKAGTKGKRTTTWEIKNSKVVGEPKITEEAPVNAIIRIGKKTFGSTYKSEEEQIIPFETKFIIDESLEPGQEVVDSEGSTGTKVRTKTITIKDGQVESVETPEYRVKKKPEDRIVRIGSKTSGEHTYTEKIPFKYHISYDKTLKSGEYVIDTEGVEGTRKTKLTITNSKVVKEETLETIDPIDAVIRVGNKDFTGKVEHEEDFSTPFKVEVRTNPDLPAGKYNTIQEGKAGSKTIKYTQAFKNGELVGDLKKEEVSSKEPLNHIIEIGIKPAENKEEYANNVGVSVKYVYDNTLDKGVVKLGELKPGKVERVVENKYNPETGEIETKTVEKVTKAEQIVIVGSKDFSGDYKYTNKENIRYETKFVEDPSLTRGEYKVVQKGELGEKVTELNQKFVNGKADGDPEIISEDITKKPVDEIVLVGTAPIKTTDKDEFERDIQYKTEFVYDENLDSGSFAIDNEGSAGKEKITRTKHYEDGVLVGNVEEEVERIKDPENKVIRIGIKPIEKTNQINYKTKYVFNPDLKDGETKVVTPGEYGELKTIISFNKDLGTIEYKEETKDPVDEIVEFGGKTEREIEFTSKIPFEIKVIKDNTLPAGKIITEQEGEEGETLVKVSIENSKEISREETPVKDPMDKIIRVGTMNVCPIPEDEPEKPEPNPEPEKDIPLTPLTPAEEDIPLTPLVPAEEDIPLTPLTPAEEVEEVEDPKDDDYYYRRRRREEKKEEKELEKKENIPSTNKEIVNMIDNPPVEAPIPPSIPEPKTEAVEEKPVQTTENVTTSDFNETASPEYKEEIANNTVTPSKPINQKNEVPPEHVKTNDPGISHIGIFGLLTSLSTMLGMLIPRKKNK